MATVPLAAEAADPFAPWVQVVIQLGALGVLLALAWQLPRAIATLKQWRVETEEAHRAERKEMAERHERARLEALEAVRALAAEVKALKEREPR